MDFIISSFLLNFTMYGMLPIIKKRVIIFSGANIVGAWVKKI